MKWFYALIMVVLLFVPSLVAGQLQDMLGIYFDTNGTINHITAIPTEQVETYIIIKNPSGLGGVYGWMGDVSVEGPAGPIDWIPNTVEACIDCCGFAGWPPFYCVYLPPTPWASNLILVQGTVLVLGSEQIRFYVLPAPGEAEIVYDAGGGPTPDLRVLYPVSGAFDSPVATINGEPPVLVESKAWGGVKALYR